MPVMSQRAYARQRGVSAEHRPEGNRDGSHLTRLPNGQIDSEHCRRRVGAQHPDPSATGRPARPATEDDAEVFGASQYTKARAVREHYQARLAKIDYEERMAKLVSGDEVQVAAFNKFRQFRDAMLNIPDRLAAMLAAETEAAKCMQSSRMRSGRP